MALLIINAFFILSMGLGGFSFYPDNIGIFIMDLFFLTEFIGFLIIIWMDHHE